jgi:hypothetical protein
MSHRSINPRLCPVLCCIFPGTVVDTRDVVHLHAPCPGAVFFPFARHESCTRWRCILRQHSTFTFRLYTTLHTQQTSIVKNYHLSCWIGKHPLIQGHSKRRTQAHPLDSRDLPTDFGLQLDLRSCDRSSILSTPATVNDFILCRHGKQQHVCRLLLIWDPPRFLTCL